MKKYLLAVAAAALLSVDAFAFGNGPFSVVPGQVQSGPLARIFIRQPLPAFQAAPWYLYWPYNAHFMTPAPLTGAYYAPPSGPGMSVNPYFPAGGTGR
jgi:hypothetical protein